MREIGDMHTPSKRAGVPIQLFFRESGTALPLMPLMAQIAHRRKKFVFADQTGWDSS
jgi:hypothetical protein